MIKDLRNKKRIIEIEIDTTNEEVNTDTFIDAIIKDIDTICTQRTVPHGILVGIKVKDA